MTREQVITKISNHLYITGAATSKKAAEMRAAEIVDMLIDAGVLLVNGS